MSERAVSSTLNYVLALSIAALLVGGLLFAGSQFVITQRDVVVEEEMSVIGQQVASNIEMADRLANASQGSTTVQVNRTFPTTVSRSQYNIRLDPDDSQVVLTSTNPEQTVRINVTSNTELSESTASGGEVTVRAEDTDSDGEKELVIDNA